MRFYSQTENVSGGVNYAYQQEASAELGPSRKGASVLTDGLTDMPVFETSGGNLTHWKWIIVVVSQKLIRLSHAVLHLPTHCQFGPCCEYISHE